MVCDSAVFPILYFANDLRSVKISGESSVRKNLKLKFFVPSIFTGGSS